MIKTTIKLLLSIVLLPVARGELTFLCSLFSGWCPTPPTPDLYGVMWNGDVVNIDRNTGAGTLVGPSGFDSLNGAANDSTGRVFTMSDNTLVEINPNTGVGTAVVTTTPPAPYDNARGIAIDSSDRIYVVWNDGFTVNQPDLLSRVNPTTGAVTSIGVMTLVGVQGLAFDASDNLFCADVVTQRVYQVNPANGATTVIGTGPVNHPVDLQSLHYDPSRASIIAARENLVEVNTATGVTTLVGATGFVDIRGLFDG